MIGRYIKTSGGTHVGSIGDFYLDSAAGVAALALIKILIDSPIAAAGHIMRDSVLYVGDDESPMIIDLAKSEEQSKKFLEEGNDS